jgi:hypothetical protein
MVEDSIKENQILLNLIRSCEIYQLNENESISYVNKILKKKIKEKERKIQILQERDGFVIKCKSKSENMTHIFYLPKEDFLKYAWKYKSFVTHNSMFFDKGIIIR